jgi:hypothetical protein
MVTETSTGRSLFILEEYDAKARGEDAYRWYGHQASGQACLVPIHWQPVGQAPRLTGEGRAHHTSIHVVLRLVRD